MVTDGTENDQIVLVAMLAANRHEIIEEMLRGKGGQSLYYANMRQDHMTVVFCAFEGFGDTYF